VGDWELRVGDPMLWELLGETERVKPYPFCGQMWHRELLLGIGSNRADVFNNVVTPLIIVRSAEISSCMTADT